MKYLFYNIIAVVFVFSGCTKKTELVFDKPVDDRLNETLTSFQTYLTQAPGWKLFVYPKGLDAQNIKVGGFTYYLKFSATNRVSMVSDFLPDVAAVPKESGYRLKALQRPSLIFDTYTYMHLPADPDPDVSMSPVGTGGYGFGTDFNFSFTTTTPKDSLVLQGNFNKSSAVLLKATQAELDSAFQQGRLKEIMDVTYPYPAANPFLYFPASPGVNVGVGFDFNHILITFSYVDAGNLVNKVSAFSFTTYGIHLQEPVTFGNYTFQDLIWDHVKKIYYFTSGSTRVELANSPTPLISISLAPIIGNQYTTITVPPGATSLPNQSPLFMVKYNGMVSSILNGPYGLTMDDLDFVFNAAGKTMDVNAYVYQSGIGPYLCQYNYTYTVDNMGVFNFTKVSQNGNAALIVSSMNLILSYIENDRFSVDGIATSVGFLGQFSSKETPAFYFSGNLY